jgi:hypothetical protein
VAFGRSWCVAIIVLMYALDAWEIGQMPKRGTPALWWCASSPISARTNMCWRRLACC